MFYGCTESESFYDPTILNNYQHYKIVVEKRGDGKGFWHIFILKVEDEHITKTTQDISTALKPDWNAIFFNEETVYCLFKDKVFTLKRQKIWQLSDYKEVKEYAKRRDVGDLDMNDVFAHYDSLLEKK